MSIRIGSFNIHNAGKNAAPEKLKLIGDIIRKEQFDIVALQEVFCDHSGVITWNTCAAPLSTILRNIGGSEWKAYFAAPRQARTAKEGYAFIWNSKKVDLPKSLDKNGLERTYYPRIFDLNWKDHPEGEKIPMLDRNPLIGRFVFKDGQFGELRIINTHIRFSAKPSVDSDNTKEEDLDIQDKHLRRFEFNVLTKRVYPRFSDRIYGKDEVASTPSNSYTIMIGDYNLSLKRKFTKSPYITDPYTEVIELPETRKGQHIILQTFQYELTSLKQITEKNQDQFERQEKYSNNYDHSTYDINRFKDIKMQTKRILAVNKYDKSDYVHYRNKVSDHIPIVVTIDTKNKDFYFINGYKENITEMNLLEGDKNNATT